MTDTAADKTMIAALEDVLSEITEKHNAAAITWNPHDLVPWTEGRNFEFLGGTDWAPSDSSMPESTRAAVLALLLTKENLPSFHRILGAHFPPFSQWRDLVGLWTAEDNRHSIALRDHLVVTRQVDPARVENLRLSHVTAGFQQSPHARTFDAPTTLAIMAVHELLCADFAARLAEEVESDSLRQMLTNVSTDDRCQAQTFMEFLKVAVKVDPDAAVLAVARALEIVPPVGTDITGLEDDVATLAADYVGAPALDRAAQAIASFLDLAGLDGLRAEADTARATVLTRR